jgi:hypothetical protein
MSEKATPIIALILLIVLIIIVIVSFSYNPSPAEIVVTPHEKTAAELLLEKCKDRRGIPENSMSPSRRHPLSCSPASTVSDTKSAWELIDEMRKAKGLIK